MRFAFIGRESWYPGKQFAENPEMSTIYQYLLYPTIYHHHYRRRPPQKSMRRFSRITDSVYFHHCDRSCWNHLDSLHSPAKRCFMYTTKTPDITSNHKIYSTYSDRMIKTSRGTNLREFFYPGFTAGAHKIPSHIHKGWAVVSCSVSATGLLERDW